VSTLTIFDYAVFDGQLLPIDQAQISIFNPSLFSSFGIYETVKVDKGRSFYLDEHLHRLLQSAKMLDMDLSVNTTSLADWFQMLMAVDPQATWSLKIIAFGPTDPTSKPIIAMHPTRLPTYPYALYQKGASVVLYEGQRLLPACKSLNTLVNYLARRKAEQMEALEGVLHYNGYLIASAIRHHPRRDFAGYAIHRSPDCRDTTAHRFIVIRRNVYFQHQHARNANYSG